MAGPTVVVLTTDPGGPQLVAGDVGVQVQVPVGPIQSLTNTTGVVMDIVAPNGVRHTVTGTASSDGTYGYWTTIATDFPIAGTYSVQMLATFTSPSQTLYSDVCTVVVGARI